MLLAHGGGTDWARLLIAGVVIRKSVGGLLIGDFAARIARPGSMPAFAGFDARVCGVCEDRSTTA
jgi:hypothetical protein